MKTLIIIFAFAPFITLRIFRRIDKMLENIEESGPYTYGLPSADDEEQIRENFFGSLYS